jgi:hypothetical protein
MGCWNPPRKTCVSRGYLDARGRRLFLTIMTEKKPLPDAARRALAEAEARRAEIDAAAKALPPEKGAKREKEPSRYGDWEKKGIASDF